MSHRSTPPSQAKKPALSPATFIRLMKATAAPVQPSPSSATEERHPDAIGPPRDEVVEYELPDADQVLIAYHNDDGKAEWKIMAPKGANLDVLHARLLTWGRGWETVKRRRRITVAE